MYSSKGISRDRGGKTHVDHAADFGIETGGKASVAFAQAQERKQGIVRGLVSGIGAMCKGRKVEVFNGVGSLRAGRTVDVTLDDGGSATITGDFVMLASGSVPRLIPGFERGGPIMTSDEVLDLSTLPDRVAVIGGGAIGCEFASTFPTSVPRSPSLRGCRKSCPASTGTSPKSSRSRSRKRRSQSRPG